VQGSKGALVAGRIHNAALLVGESGPELAAGQHPAIQTLRQHTADKDVTGKEGLNHMHGPAPGRALNPQAGMEHLQAQVLLQGAGGKVLMLGVRASTILGQ